MKKYSILIVDDEPTNLKILINILQPEYKVLVANSGENALQVLENQEMPDLVLLDVMMPEMSGFEVCSRMKKNPRTHHVPVIFVTAKVDAISEEEGFNLGAVDYISKPVIPSVVLARVKTHLALYDQNRALELQVTERTAQLNETRLEVIQCLGLAAEYRDNETGMHVIRMAHYSRMLAEALEIDSAWVETLFNAAPMHDIGKIGIPDRILLKPGKLDDDELIIMRTHAEIGAKILSGLKGSRLFELASSVAMTHHERWDGGGYPSGLVAEEIPLEGRIVAIADVFDALLSKRPYKKPWTVDDAMDLLQQEAGQHFDPSMVPVFIELRPELEKIMHSFPDESVS